MKINETTAAKKLTLEEIKALPFASVIWYANVANDYGVVWHCKAPVVVYVPGYDGCLGGTLCGDGIFEQRINENMFKDPNGSYWNIEPDDDQLPGITEAEYNETWNEEDIVFPKLAEEITGRKLTFDKFCKMVDMDIKEFWAALTGEREFKRMEIVAIRSVLKLTDDQTREIFFPECVLKESSEALAQI